MVLPMSQKRLVELFISQNTSTGFYNAFPPLQRKGDTLIEPNKHEHIKTFGNNKQPNANRLMHSSPSATTLTTSSNTQASGATPNKAWQ
jgi:hypothetical protein